jgi:hypothetical protein
MNLRKTELGMVGPEKIEVELKGSRDTKNDATWGKIDPDLDDEADSPGGTNEMGRTRSVPPS